MTVHDILTGFVVLLALLPFGVAAGLAVAIILATLGDGEK